MESDQFPSAAEDALHGLLDVDIGITVDEVEPGAADAIS